MLYPVVCVGIIQIRKHDDMVRTLIEVNHIRNYEEDPHIFDYSILLVVTIFYR